MKTPIYMDNHATTPVDPRVVAAMLPYFTEKFGNASSRNHAFGWESEAAVDSARAQLANLIHAASAKEIIFTAGATESDNLAVKGIANGYGRKGNHIITCVTEHKAVLDSCKTLEASGYHVSYLPVDSDGFVDCQRVRDAITEKTILISVMAANNETGTLQPVEEIGRMARMKNIVFHTDATQAVGKIPFDVQKIGADLVSFSAHKMYGPKGVGALYVRSTKPAIRLTSMMDGGGHERGMRSGTLNVPGIVGFGVACEIAGKEMVAESQRLIALRERLKNGILNELEHVHVNGHPTTRLPGNLNMSFASVEGEALLMALKDIAVSTGSACTSASVEPSYVLRAMGVEDESALASIRFGLGRFNTAEEVDYTAQRVVQEVRRLRQMSPRKARVRRPDVRGEKLEERLS
jgi:cysteine desulfurase